MFYVYLIGSLSSNEQRYVGLTTDLKRRLQEHNDGKSYHTSKFKPWRLVTYVAFSDRAKAESLNDISNQDQVTPSPANDYGRAMA